MNIKCFESSTPPWMNLQKFKKYADDNGVLIKHGVRNNQTDGEIHYLLSRGDESFEVHANYWNCRSQAWEDAINWIKNERFFNKGF